VYVFFFAFLSGCAPPQPGPVETIEYLYKIGDSLMGKSRVTIDETVRDRTLVSRYRCESILQDNSGEEVFDSTFAELTAVDLKPLNSRKTIISGETSQVYTATYDAGDSLVTVNIKTGTQSFPYYYDYNRPLFDIETIPLWLVNRGFAPGDTVSFEILAPALATTILTRLTATGNNEVETGNSRYEALHVQFEMIEKPNLESWREYSAELAAAMDSLQRVIESAPPPAPPPHPDSFDGFIDRFHGVFPGDGDEAGTVEYAKCTELLDKMGRIRIHEVHYWIAEEEDRRFIVKYLDPRLEALMLLIERTIDE